MRSHYFYRDRNTSSAYYRHKTNVSEIFKQLHCFLRKFLWLVLAILYDENSDDQLPFFSPESNKIIPCQTSAFKPDPTSNSNMFHHLGVQAAPVLQMEKLRYRAISSKSCSQELSLALSGLASVPLSTLDHIAFLSRLFKKLSASWEARLLPIDWALLSNLGV